MRAFNQRWTLAGLYTLWSVTAVLPVTAQEPNGTVGSPTAPIDPTTQRPNPIRPWSDAELVTRLAPFQDGSLSAALKQAALLGRQPRAWPAMTQRLQGDHREYALRIRLLLDQLADPRWQTRQDAEQRLVAIGERAWSLIRTMAKEGESLEQRLRAARVLQGIRDKGSSDLERELRLNQGVAFAVRGLPRGAAKPPEGLGELRQPLERALVSCLSHPDALMRERGLQAIRWHGGPDAVPQLLARGPQSDEGVPYWAALTAMTLPTEAAGHSRWAPAGVDAIQNLWQADIRPDLQAATVRELLHRKTWFVEGCPLPPERLSPRVRKEVKAWLAMDGGPDQPRESAPAAGTMRIELTGGTQLTGELVATTGAAFLVRRLGTGADAFPLAWGECAEFSWPERTPVAGPRVQVFLTQGGVLAADTVQLERRTLRLTGTLLGDIELPRTAVQGVSLDPESTRLVGLSTDRDLIRFHGGNALRGGRIVSMDATQVVWQERDSEATSAPLERVQTLMFKLEPDRDPVTVRGQDQVRFTRLDTVQGDRLLAHVLYLDGAEALLDLPGVGVGRIPTASVFRLEPLVQGGAQWRFTLVADYADGRLVEFDERGRETFSLNDVVGVWDAECLPNGNLLVTEFTASRVREFDRQGEVVWEFRQVRNPYEADRLPNGNTLIADTYGGRVIEVNTAGQIVWTLAEGIRPMDVERLSGGNTLVGDGNGSRVLEVNESGEVVWSLEKVGNPYDVDRLRNGNTLVTLREENRIVEYRPDGTIQWQLNDLRNPSDADRLPNGNTLVAENGEIREFSKDGKLVRRLPVAWAVEVNRY